MKKNKIFTIVAASILAVSFLVFSLEKLHVTNFYEKPVSTTISDPPRPVNNVDYTPQTSPPDPTINSEKNPGDTGSTTTPTPSSVTVTITRANQDSTTKNLNVGVLVDGTKTGTCKLELLQNNVAVITKSADIAEQSGLFTCAGFTVLNSEIPSAGTYTVKISVGTASASQTKDLIK